MQATGLARAFEPSGNSLLDALHKPEFGRLAPHLDLVTLSSSQALDLTHAYFPKTAIVSLLPAADGGLSEEVAVTGNEGLIGISTFLELGGGTAAPPRRAIVQHAGQAWRLPARVLADHFENNPNLQRILLRFTQALLTQIAQTVVCNRHHKIAEQLCRWLLLRLDRLPDHQVQITHERIARLLGVRREAVTAAAKDLRGAGIVRLDRGRVSVLDRPRLEQKACECYAVIRKEYARLLLPRDDRGQSSQQLLRARKAPHAVAGRSS